MLQISKIINNDVKLIATATRTRASFRQGNGAISIIYLYTCTLNKVNITIKRCLTFVTEGDGDPGLVRDELRNLEARKRDLELKLAATHDEQAVEPHPNMAELYVRKVSELQTLLIDETSRPQAMDIIRSMIDHIEIHVGTERSTPNVILVGALAQILAFTQQNKTAASNGSDGRVLMVAGARSLPFRTPVSTFLSLPA